VRAIGNLQRLRAVESEGLTFQTPVGSNQLTGIRSVTAPERATVQYGNCKRETASSTRHGRMSRKDMPPPARPLWPELGILNRASARRGTQDGSEVTATLERWRGRRSFSRARDIESLECPQGTIAATVNALVSTPLRQECLAPARPRPLRCRCSHSPKGCMERDQMCVSRPSGALRTRPASLRDRLPIGSTVLTGGHDVASATLSKCSAPEPARKADSVPASDTRPAG